MILKEKVFKMERKIEQILSKEQTDIYLKDLNQNLNSANKNNNFVQDQDFDVANYNSAEKLDLEVFNETKNENNFLKNIIHELDQKILDFSTQKTLKNSKIQELEKKNT